MQASLDRPHDRSWKLYTQNASDSSGPTSNQIFALRADRSGYLWVGSEAGLERYEPATNEWKRPDSWRDATLRIPQRVVQGITEDDFGGIWVSVVESGIFRIDPKDGHLLQLKHEPANPESLPFDQIWLTEYPTGWSSRRLHRICNRWILGDMANRHTRGTLHTNHLQPS